MKAIVTVVLSLMFCCGIWGQEASAPVQSFACATDRSITSAETHVRLYVWNARGNNTYIWSTTGGKLLHNSGVTDWDLSGERPGVYEAVAVQGDLRCVVHVIVTYLSEKRGSGVSRISGISFLQSGNAEEDGFGLYSYFLLGSRPTDELTRTLVLHVLDAIVADIPNMKNLRMMVAGRRLVPDSGINLVLIPVTVLPSADPTSEWILAHYDYARAAILLAKMPGAHRRGPYLISTLKPLTVNSIGGQNYLYQDVSWVTDEVASAWVRIFLDQAEQERFWNSLIAERLALNLRTAISVAGQGLPAVKVGLHDWLNWN